MIIVLLLSASAAFTVVLMYDAARFIAWFQYDIYTFTYTYAQIEDRQLVDRQTRLDKKTGGQIVENDLGKPEERAITNMPTVWDPTHTCFENI